MYVYVAGVAAVALAVALVWGRREAALKLAGLVLDEKLKRCAAIEMPYLGRIDAVPARFFPAF
jgi:hypothetical protein